MSERQGEGGERKAIKEMIEKRGKEGIKGRPVGIMKRKRVGF